MTMKKFEFDLKLEKGSILKPSTFEYHLQSSKNYQSEKPLKYHSDVLISLSYLNLNRAFSKFGRNELENSTELWRQLEPHYEMYARSRKRVIALREQLNPSLENLTESFEKKFTESIKNIWSENKIEFKDLSVIIDLVDYLEDHLKQPLVYNFSLQFSPEFQQQLLFIYSFLWNVRSLVAIDHNSYVEDTSHEAIKMDSITDYLPKSEYVVNDALMYHHFKKLFMPFVSGRSSDVKIEKLLYEPLHKHFHKYSHNACHLIDHLPEKFIQSLSPKDLEEALFLVQMDWLLGSEAGLLFKIREELFGLQEGYEKIFWTEYDFKSHQHSVNLKVSCELPAKKAAKKTA